jgi:raffinose/stachyose/melibiose transport system substrate-binding protein
MEGNMKKSSQQRISLRRTISVPAAVLAAVMLAGCSGSGQSLKLKNDIKTMQEPDPGKMTITIRAEYNVDNEALRSALAEKFPDVNFVSVFHCSPETQYELYQSLQGGTAEDLVISPNMKAAAEIAPGCLLDLSAEDFTQNYNAEALEKCQIDGKLYYLPGPSSIYGIVYDRTMFAEHGWKVPHSYDEFTELVKQIDAAGIRAIQPTCKYARQAQMIFTMFNYADTFESVDDYRWLLDFQQGKTSMEGHLDAALAKYQEMNRTGIIRPEDFDMQPGNRSKMLYTDHTCAMIIENEQAAHYAEQAGSDHEYGMFPFWSGGSGTDYLMSQPGYYIGLSAALGKKGNEAKLARAKEILRYISTPEGQLAICGGKMTQISNLKNTEYAANDFNADIMDTVRRGNLVSEVDLMASGNNNAAEKMLQTDLRKLLEGSVTDKDLEKDCDEARTKALREGTVRGETAGTAEKTFTPLETGLFIADALKEKAGADIGLCLVGTAHRGMAGRFYKGDIGSKDIDSLSLSVGTVSDNPDDKKLWLVSMTGSQILDLLREGYGYDPNDNVPNIPYYVASGLKIRFAPWKEDKLVSVKMADGSALDSGKTYTVALWGWPFDDACLGTVQKVFEDSSDDILTEAVKKAGTITPYTDARFTLVY